MRRSPPSHGVYWMIAVAVAVLLAAPLPRVLAAFASQSGDWQAGSSWQAGSAPTVGDSTCVINDDVTLSILSAAIYPASPVTIGVGSAVGNASLIVAPGLGTVTLGAMRVLNGGKIQVGAGTTLRVSSIELEAGTQPFLFFGPGTLQVVDRFNTTVNPLPTQIQCSSAAPLQIVIVSTTLAIQFSGSVVMSGGCVWQSSLSATRIEMRGGGPLLGSMTFAASVNFTNTFDTQTGTGPVIGASIYAPGATGVAFTNATLIDGAAFVQTPSPTQVTLVSTLLYVNGFMKIFTLQMFQSNITLGPLANLVVVDGRLSIGRHAIVSRGGVISGVIQRNVFGSVQMCVDGSPFVGLLASFRLYLERGNLTSCTGEGINGLLGSFEYGVGQFPQPAGSGYDVIISSSEPKANVTLVGWIYLPSYRNDWFSHLTNGAMVVAKFALNLFIPAGMELRMPALVWTSQIRISFMGDNSRLVLTSPYSLIGTGTDQITLACTACRGVGVNLTAGVIWSGVNVQTEFTVAAQSYGFESVAYFSGPGQHIGGQLAFPSNGWRLTGGITVPRVFVNFPLSRLTVDPGTIFSDGITMFDGIMIFNGQVSVPGSISLNAGTQFLFMPASNGSFLNNPPFASGGVVNITGTGGGTTIAFGNIMQGRVKCVGVGVCNIIYGSGPGPTMMNSVDIEPVGTSTSINLYIRNDMVINSGTLVINKRVTLYALGITGGSPPFDFLVFGTLAGSGMTGKPGGSYGYFPTISLLKGAVVMTSLTGDWTSILALDPSGLNITANQPITLAKLTLGGTLYINAAGGLTVLSLTALSGSGLTNGDLPSAELMPVSVENFNVSVGSSVNFVLDRIGLTIFGAWRIFAGANSNQFILKSGSVISYRPFNGVNGPNAGSAYVSYPALSGAGAGIVVAFNYSLSPAVAPNQETIAFSTPATFLFSGVTTGTVKLGVCVSGDTLLAPNPAIAISEPANCPLHVGPSTAVISSSAELISSSAELISSSAELISSSAERISSSAAVVPPSSSAGLAPLSSTAVAAPHLSSSAAAAPASPSSSAAAAAAGPSSSAPAAPAAGPSSSAAAASGVSSSGDSNSTSSACSPVNPCNSGGTCHAVAAAAQSYFCDCTAAYDGVNCQTAYDPDIAPASAGFISFRIDFLITALSTTPGYVFQPEDAIAWFNRVNTLVRAAAVASGVVSNPIDSVAVVSSTALAAGGTARVWLSLSNTPDSAAIRNLFRELIGNAELVQADIGAVKYTDEDGPLLSGALIPGPKPTASEAVSSNQTLLIGLLIALAAVIIILIALQKAVPHSRVSELANVTLSLAVFASNSAFVASLKDSGSAARYYSSLGLLCLSVLGHIIIVFWLIDQDLRRKDFARWMAGPLGFRAVAIVSVLGFVAPANLRLLDSHIANLRVLSAPFSETSNLRITIAGLVSVVCVGIPLLVIQALTSYV